MTDVELIKNIMESSYFELKLEKDVYWVPYNVLSENKLSLEELMRLVSKSPEEKKKAIHTIIDAVLLFILSDFHETSDNVFIKENEIIWEHCKPGRLSVLSNEGCCASCSAWLNYLLQDDFEEKVYIPTHETRMHGHLEPL